jgi:hypothetical protein
MKAACLWSLLGTVRHLLGHPVHPLGKAITLPPFGPRASAMRKRMLEKLMGDREGAWSIRINDQWRVCFRWEDGNAHDVEIVDYH